jgi:hypothetical protein
MRQNAQKDAESGLEEGFSVAAIQPSEAQGSLNIGIVVRAQLDPATGAFVLLRKTPKANVFLGCMSDSAGRILEWLEVWVQEVESFGVSVPAFLDRLTNAVLDEEWRRLAEDLERLSPSSYVATRMESTPSLPVILPSAGGDPVPLTDPDSGESWKLCVEENALKEAGLPSYQTTRYRYLRAPRGLETDPFLRLSPAAPGNEKTRDLSASVPAERAPYLLNPGGNRMLVRRFAPLSLEDYADVLGGKIWSGLVNGRKIVRLSGVYRTLENQDLLRSGSLHLFSTRSGLHGKLAETLHLKLHLIRETIEQVRALTESQRLPLLNLNADSFRVRLSTTDTGLPAFWTARTELVVPGHAFALDIENTSTRFFHSREFLTATIYRPDFAARTKAGSAGLRIRRVLPPAREGVVVEGTLNTREDLSAERSDLLCFRVPIRGKDFDLYAQVSSTEALAQGEAAFRTIPQNLDAAGFEALRSIEGVAFTQIPFTLLPPLSSPCDLYSLGVIAARILLVNERNSLPYAVDALLSLARELANRTGSPESVASRVQAIFESNDRWMKSLGPQHLVQSEVSPEEAASFLPATLWWEVLGFLSRLFPGASQDSFCRDFGDATPLALEMTFDKPLQMLHALVTRSRAVLIADWKYNREISEVIKSLAESLG